MGWQTTPYVVLFSLTATGALCLAGLAWHRRGEPGGRELAVVMGCLSVSTFAYVVSLASTRLGPKLLFSRLSFAFMFFIGPAWLWFAVRYTGLRRWENRRTVAALFTEPVVVGALVALPVLDTLVIQSAGLETVGGVVSLTMVPGLLLTAAFGYHYLLFAVGSILFVRFFLRSRHLYRAQAGALLAGALVPWAGNALFLTGLFDRVHLFPVLLSVSGVAMTLALYRFRVVDPVPTGRRSVVEEMGDGVLVVTEDDRVGDINPAARELLDCTAGPVVGEPVASVLPTWGSLTTEGDGATEWQETEVRNGTEDLVLEVQVTPFADHHDRQVGRLVVMRDVTARIRRERTLARYKTIFESVQDRVYVLDEDGTFVMVNEPMAEMTGRSRLDLVGTHASTVFAGVAFDEAAVKSTGATECTVVTADGDRIPCETYRSPVEWTDGEFTTVGVVRDISERRAAQESLREASHTLETLVNASPLAVVATDPDGLVEVWNPAAESVFGWTTREVLGSPVPFDREGESDLWELTDRVLAGERVTDYESTLEDHDGTPVEASISAAPLHDAAGSIDGVVMLIADITDRKEHERELERKNEQLEQFASVLSHDLRNPLNVASGSLELARTDGADEHFERIAEAHDRMERIIQGMLDLAREGQSVSDTVPVPLADLAADAWGTVDTGDASLSVTSGMVVDADRARLRQVLENLYRNAVEHGGPDVAVTVGPLPEGEGFYVADDGPGIPPEERGRVLEYGHTTESDGTGFGLAIVDRIAEAHEWDLAVTESEEGGARFEFATRTSESRQVG